MGAWEITKKDLRLLTRDRRALVTLVAFPLIFIGILGISSGKLLGWKAENELLKITVVDEDGGEVAAELVRSLQRRDGLRIKRVTSREEARKLVADRECSVALFIGSGFQRRVDELKIRDILDPQQGRLADGLESLDMQVEGRQSVSNTGAIVGQLVLSVAVRTVTPHVVRKNKLAARFLRRSLSRTSETGESESNVGQAFQPATADRQAKSLPHKAADRRSSIVYQELVPSYTVMFVFFLVNIMARSFIHERELGTLRRLRIAPIAAVSVLIGKTLPFFIISLAQTGLLFLSGRVLFGMSWGTLPFLLLPVIACTSLAATGLGLLVATLARTDSQVSAYGNFVVITMAGISVCFMPRDWLPTLMQKISLATPHSWALIAYDQLLSASVPAVATVALSCCVLVAFALLFFLLGCLRFRRYA